MTVELRDLRPDVGAEFNFEAWEITLDRAAVESGDLTAEQFAALSDSVAHEARHALHHFRGIRAALVEGEFDYNAPVDADAIRAAKAANAHGAGERLRPGDPAFRASPGGLPAGPRARAGPGRVPPSGDRGEEPRPCRVLAAHAPPTAATGSGAAPGVG